MPSIKTARSKYANADLLAPSFEILVGERPISAGANASLIGIEISEDFDAPSMVALELENWDLSTSQVSWSDDDLFDIGKQVEVKLGYGPSRTSIFVGEITGLEPEFSLAQSPRLIVRGHDFSHRLMRGTKTRTFTGMPDSRIVEEVARNAKLTVKATPTAEKLDYVLQHNQTDLAFIRQRAARIGYEVIVQHKTLLFRPLKPQSQPAVTLNRKDLLEFSPRLSTLGMVGEVEVHSWDAKQKKAILLGKASHRDVEALGQTSGVKTAVKEFGKTTQVIIDPPATTKEVQAIAQGQLNRIALGYITGDGACSGRPDLRAGQSIQMNGLGKRFSGVYYVTATTHRFVRDEGYQTQFSVRRNAA
jgi:phage protein D